LLKHIQTIQDNALIASVFVLAATRIHDFRKKQFLTARRFRYHTHTVRAPAHHHHTTLGTPAHHYAKHRRSPAMTIVRTFTLPHYEAFPIHVALFRDVKNASHLRSQLLEANAEYDYAFLDAEMVRPDFLFISSLVLVISYFDFRIWAHAKVYRHVFRD
jgi:hypothetical protein